MKQPVIGEMTAENAWPGWNQVQTVFEGCLQKTW